MSNRESLEPSLPDLLRRHDRDRFLATLCAPVARQPALWAVLGFNYEIARVREMVSQPILGQIRLQWWRDALDEIYAGKPVRRHEVATPLAQAIRDYRVSRAHLDTMIDARERDLAGEPPATLADLENWLDDTSSRLLQVQIEILTGTEGGEAARRIGLAWGLVGTIRAVPFHAAAKIIRIPAEIAQAADLHERDLFALRPSAPLAAALERLAAVALEHLAAARALRPSVPPQALPALVIARLAQHYLRVLATAGYDPYAAIVQQPDTLAAWRVGWGRLIGRY
jgi:NADH dehydrogenase [ubiquinone] 1 alpha subcomplex assembly factor 6